MSESKPKLLGLVYARVSTKRQENEGSGLGSQEARCKAYLDSKGVPYHKSFLDSYSGKGDFMDRPAMRELIEYLDAHPDQDFVIVFDDLKRFARDVIFHIKLRALFRTKRVKLHCLNYNFDESPEGQFVETIFAGQAQLEREQNRRQVMQKMKARLETGYWTFGGKRGYSRNKRTGIFEPTKQAEDFLKKALEGFAAGVFVRKIDVARYLVENGFWKGKRPEKYIHVISAIMRDPFYVGDIEYLPWSVVRIKGKHKGIISEEVFRQIQRRLKGEDRGTRIRVDVSSDFPLRGLISCASCDRPLTAAWTTGRKNKYPYYFCQNRECEIHGKTIKKETIEKEFSEVLKENALKPEVANLMTAVFECVWKEEVSTLEARKNSLKVEIKALEVRERKFAEAAAGAKSEAIRRAYENQLEFIVKEAEALTAEELILNGDRSVPYRNALDKALALIKSPYSVWENLEVLEKHQLFFFLFNGKLVYSKKEGYRNAENLSTARLFEEFATANPHHVEMPGIEPGSKRGDIGYLRG